MRKGRFDTHTHTKTYARVRARTKNKDCSEQHDYWTSWSTQKDLFVGGVGRQTKRSLKKSEPDKWQVVMWVFFWSTPFNSRQNVIISEVVTIENHILPPSHSTGSECCWLGCWCISKISVWNCEALNRSSTRWKAHVFQLDFAPADRSCIVLRFGGDWYTWLHHAKDMDKFFVLNPLQNYAKTFQMY